MLTLLAGCSQAGAPEEDSTALPDQPKFEGTVNADLVGRWKSTNGSSDMTLESSGKMSFATQVNTPGGKQNVKIDGDWLAKDSALLLKDPSGGRVKVIVYTFKLVDPKTLELSLSFPKATTTYKKQ